MTWALAALAVALFLLAGRRRPMDAAARAGAPGQIADLPSGRTHYRWIGPENGPVALCLHGISTGGWFTEGLAGMLARRGYRVLVPDLYGRGFSDRPPGPQTRAFFLRQIDELLDTLGVGGGLTVLGYSMGGAIATALAADRPGRVGRLILIAPAGLGQITPWPAALARDLPGLGDAAMGLLGGVMVRAVARILGRAQNVPGALIAAQVEETRYRGFLPAMLSSMRHLLAGDFAPDHRRIAAAGLPVLAIWAEADELIAPTASERLAGLNPGAAQLTLPGAGHVLPITHAPQVHDAIEAFLGR
ncbi:alpha/beta fold hydrolase [Rhodovulum euryhalinum]|uniref:Pimeloyl-ACP methyl ester carboxylesterase n=1 Tax=Rhodovulum euryhalinum TaxID=35805 RepID=A0A4R2L342_9RHOB|nr:alpha/beta fold hydrolase [Rhodovulum euryhalinum]TCO73525.1 pimeloyl-ACP methyl ester carboxylesterase [Rhodovulum euryhalinum]